tara:strand:+ start:303 stop:449 length:147 start_codon:yes stop_codon:yes gene_type:complete
LTQKHESPVIDGDWPSMRELEVEQSLTQPFHKSTNANNVPAFQNKQNT